MNLKKQRRQIKANFIKKFIAVQQGRQLFAHESPDTYCLLIKSIIVAVIIHLNEKDQKSMRKYLHKNCEKWMQKQIKKELKN